MTTELFGTPVVCEDCHGQGCHQCDHSGHVTPARAEENRRAARPTLGQLAEQLADNLESVGCSETEMTVDVTWARALLELVPTWQETTLVRTMALDRLRELADVADTIAVWGENRFAEGRYVPYAASVMGEMRSVIRFSLPAVPDSSSDLS